jgi:hypothetical protein
VTGLHPQRRAAAVLVGSLLAHAALLAGFAVHLDSAGQAPTLAGAELPLPPAPPADGALAPESWAGVAMINERQLGELTVAMTGPADQAGADS